MSSFFIIFLVIISLCNFIILYKAFPLAKFLKIIDFPNNEKKIHTKPTPLIGGLIFFINIFLFFLFEFLTQFNSITNSEFFFNLRFISLKQLITFLFVFILIYIIGFYDDMYDVSPLKKTLLFLVFIYLLLISNPNIPISRLQFYNFENNIYFNNFSIFLTLFCFLAFMNASNMFDGLNLQSSILYSSFLLIFYIKGIDHKFLLVFLLSLIFFSYMNLKEKSFLGNNGSYFLSFFIATIIISDHNWNKNYYVEEIFLYMMLPGIDMIRLSILRFLNNKSPFEGDNNHIHHLLMRKFNYRKTMIIIFLLIFSPILLFNLVKINPILLILLFLALYIFILNICLKIGVEKKF